jgi:hypothetical protein
MLSHSLFFIYACAHLRRPTRDGETLHIPLKHNMRSTVESRPDKPWSLVLVWSLRYKNCTDSMNTSSSEHMELQLGRRLGSAVFSGLSCGRGKLSYLILSLLSCQFHYSSTTVSATYCMKCSSPLKCSPSFSPVRRPSWCSKGPHFWLGRR